MPFVEDAHQIDREVADVAHSGIDVRAGHRARGRGLEVAEIRLLAGPGVGLRGVQARATRHGFLWCAGTAW
jgi:hypothetical protein